MSIGLLGDTHTNVPATVAAIYQMADAGVHQILQTGDFGYFPQHGRGVHFLNCVDAALCDTGISLGFPDGNHEDHAQLTPLERDADGAGIITERIRNLPRGHVFEAGGLRWMSFGGAISVGRKRRWTAGHDRWHDEVFTDEQLEHAGAAGPVDVLLSHDRPGIDPRLLQSAHASQRKLGELALEPGVSQIIHGHHHHSHTMVWEGITVIGMGSDIHPQHGFWKIWDTPAPRSVAPVAP